MSLEAKITELAQSIGLDIKIFKDLRGVLVVTKNGNQNLLTNSYADIILFDIPETSTLTGINFNNALGTLTCSIAGNYEITFTTSLDQYSGNNRSSVYIRMIKNGTLVKGTEQIGYHRQNTHGFNNYCISRIVSLEINDVLKFQGRNHDATRLHRVLENSTSLTIKKL